MRKILEILFKILQVFSKRTNSKEKVMPSFGSTSARNLSEAHPLLQELFEEVVKWFDCSVICGHRNEETQNRFFNAVPQITKVKWPDSKHNSTPSMAVDAVPYYGHRTPHIDWEEEVEFAIFAGFVLGLAQAMGIQVKNGTDWDQDWDLKETKFVDFPHFELVSTERLSGLSNPFDVKSLVIFKERAMLLEKENEDLREKLSKIINIAKGE